MNNILHIPRRFTRNEWGGTETVLENLCKEQEKSGQRPTILTSMALDSTPYSLMGNVPIHRVPYTYPYSGLSADEKLRMDKKGGNLISLSLFKKCLQAKDVRVFHAHTLKRMGAIVQTAAKWKRKPFVVTLHGNYFDIPQQEYSALTEIPNQHFEWGKVIGALTGSRNLLNNADAVVCISKKEYEMAREKLEHDRIYYLPNGVSTRNFIGGARLETRERLGIGKSTFLMGSISRIDPQKNQLILVRALKKLKAQGKNAALLIAGPVTNRAYLNDIEQYVKENQLENEVRILDAVVSGSEEHRNLLAALDLFCTPSIHEPFGIVVLESWSAKVPVLASDVGGLRDLIQDGVTGYQFPSESCEELVSKVSTIMETEDSHEVTEHAFSLAKNKYDWEIISKQQENIYQQAEKNKYEN